MPWVHSDVVLPEGLQLIVKGILLRDLKERHGLPWVLLRFSNLSHVLHWLVFKVLAQLELEEILGIVILVEVGQPSVEDIRVMLIRLHGLFI